MIEKNLKALVDDFHRNIDVYKTNAYNEANTRIQFIDRFFELLGWDVNNKQGFSEAYKEVVHEDSLKIGSYMKAPDYSFRLGGSRVFFVEAKKPAIDIKNDIVPAYQLRRYGWTAKLPVSILTDFEEFAVYDCRVKPNQTDKASTARILYFTYKDFLEKWDEIYALFGKENILKGSLENFVKSAKKIKGSSEVDKEFLKEISSWRDVLARNIALRNSNLSSRDLNFCVQRTIDRIIFLRMCEDRGIEDYGRLKALTNGGRIYPRLFQLFQAADDRYNSGLFYFRKEKGREELPDEVSPLIEIDDKIIKNILTGLYYPDCPYEFSVLPADILGNVYEQFLGKVIRLTAGHQAKVEEKPEVKKAGGVYYTPKYIVDYIVENTIGEKLKQKTEDGGRKTEDGGRKTENKSKIKNIKLKILDPACGSGSFLLGAYQYLLDWHLKFYSENEPEKWLKKKNPPIYQCKNPLLRGVPDRAGCVPKCEQSPPSKVSDPAHAGGNLGGCNSGGFKLTTTEKKRILLDNIYGVDIDSQAVEVTKLSLLLKVLEDVNQDALESQLKLFHERALPDLSRNIKCGNSLIGPDFYENQQLDLLDEEEQLKINVFDWQSAFPDVFNQQNPGFDIVIGNPPYVKEYTDKTTFHHLKDSKLKKYYQGKMDLWYVFACHSIDLLKENGLHSFIATNNWVTNAGASRLRNKILEDTKILKYIDFADFKVFESAGIQTMIYILEKNNRNKKYKAKYSKLLNSNFPKNKINEFLYNYKNFECISFDSNIIKKDFLNQIITFIPNRISGILDKLKNNENFKLENKEVAQGIVGAPDKAFIINRNELKNYNTPEQKFIKMFHTNAGKYYTANTEKYIFYIYANNFINCKLNDFINIKNHFSNYSDALKKAKIKYKTPKKPYFFLHRERDENFFLKGSKIICSTRTRKSSCTYTEEEFYGSRALNFIKTDRIDLKYLTGILNSSIANIWLKYMGKMTGDLLQIDKSQLMSIPIKNLDLSNSTDKKHHNQMTKYVDRMLELHKRIERVKTPYEKTNIQNQISATDKAIDKLVYELYELTPEEIKIIEKK